MEKDITKKAFSGSPIQTDEGFVYPDENPQGRSNPDLKAVYNEIDAIKRRMGDIITLLRNNGIVL